MKRKNFIKGLGSLSLLPLLPGTLSAAKSLLPDQPVIKPKALKKGDTIGLVTPGSSVSEEELDDSIKALEELGFKTYYTDAVLAKTGYLGGADTERAEELNHMFRNPDVDGIVAARGGYGCERILPMLDYNLIRNNPKVIVGYSDITALLYGIFAKTGVVTFHGPVGISTFNEFSVNHFKNVLMNPQESYKMLQAEEDKENDDKDYELLKIRSGKARGKLVGGNLTIAANLIGTPYDVDYTGKLLYFEEVGEDPYRIDRMFTELMLAGKLQKAAGIVLGIFRNCDIDPEKHERENSFTLREVLYDRLYSLGIPVIYGMSFGHVTNKYTLPFGTEAELDVLNESLTLTEPAVV